jgi:ATP-dependent Clp protease ATP-binding subunit ClpC
MGDSRAASTQVEEALGREVRSLVRAARAGELRVADFREAEIAAVLEHLDKRRSVLLVGEAGVGKTTVLHGVAQAMDARGRGGLFETSTIGLFAGTRWQGEWQTKVTRIADSVAELGAALFVTDVINFGNAGSTVQSDQTVLDALRPYVESGRLRLVAEATPEILRAMQRVQGFVRLFQQVDVRPLTAEQVDSALARAADRRQAVVDDASRRALVTLTSRFLATRPQPGPAANLLEQVIDYQEQKRGIGEIEAISPAFVERVFSITSGLPPFVVSRSVTMPAADIRAWFSERIVGQGDAIAAVVETIALFKAGLHDPAKPLGALLFVGPTGVGKTEIARSLATFLFGSEQRLLRFDLSEFKDYGSFAMLLGDAHAPDRPARLLDPVRAHPFQVVLFDELEKAHPNIWDLLLPLLDEGRATAPNGDTVDFRNTVLIATSNVGARQAGRSVGFGADGDDAGLRGERTRAALEAEFRPEFLNRFQHVVVFHALSKDQLRTVARQEIGRVLRREGISGRGLVVDVDDEALDVVIAAGVDTRYGARALKREVQRRVVVPLALTLNDRDVAAGTILKVSAHHGQLKIRVVETEASRRDRDEREPARDVGGGRVSAADLAARTAAATARIDDLAKALDLPRLETERERLVAERQAPDFWRAPAQAERVHSALVAIEDAIGRVARLRERVESVRKALESPAGRSAIEKLAARVHALDEAIGDARRELLLLGAGANADALIEIRPVGGTGRSARDLLVEVYTAWARHHRHLVDWLREPRDDEEAALLGVKGPYVYGMLQRETGLHRVRPGGDGPAGRTSVASVRVVTWGDDRVAPSIVAERPLKATGQYGGKVRSRLECEGGLVLQSGRTLAENREVAREIAASWTRVPAASDEIVRRYDREPPLVRDARTGISSGRPDALSPEGFDALVRAAIDAAAG